MKSEFLKIVAIIIIFMSVLWDLDVSVNCQNKN